MRSVGPTSAESSQFPQTGQHKLDIQGLTERGSEVGSGDLPTLSAPIPVPPAPGPQEVAGKGRMQDAGGPVPGEAEAPQGKFIAADVRRLGTSGTHLAGLAPANPALRPPPPPGMGQLHAFLCCHVTAPQHHSHQVSRFGGS